MKLIHKLPFRFNKKDNVVFSSSVIPAQTNIDNRNKLDNKLKKSGVRLFKNVHVSGHAGREDLRDLLELVNPEHIIPAHGSHEKIAPMIDLALELGYKRKNLHLLNNQEKLAL